MQMIRTDRYCASIEKNQNQVGFTLVEIAIVLVIIGLLLGGILKGQEMINSARARHNPAGSEFLEPNALWEQLAKAGFIEGAYTGDPGSPTTTSAQAPLNAFNNIIVLGRTADYQDDGTPAVRLNLTLGRGIPVDIARETDLKLDDGNPLTGVLRLAIDDPGNVFNTIGSTDPGCAAANEYNVAGDVQDCNLVYLY